MNILGLNFGHDAGVSLVVDGVFERHWEKERHVRLKHAMGLTSGDILGALAYMETRLEDIDQIAVTSTQGVPLMLFGDIDVRLADRGWPRDREAESLAVPGADFFHQAARYRPVLAWGSQAPARELLVKERELCGPFRNVTLGELGSIDRVPEGLARRMCLGLEVSLGGRRFEAAYVSHHLCHAWYSYGESQSNAAIVITADGVLPHGSSFMSGGIFFARDGTISPVTPHFLTIGSWYNGTGTRLGLGDNLGASGKLMGLAAWGKAAYLNGAMIGNLADLAAAARSRILHQRAVYGWIAAAGPLAPPGTLRSCEVPPERESDLAASAQAMFEQTMLRTVHTADRIARNAGFEYETIVLGGGCALNCPANSLIHRRFGKPVFIPPAVNDEGIGAGAALALHGLLGGQSGHGGVRSMGRIAYKGKAYTVTRAQLEPFLGELEIVPTDAPAAYLAKAIGDGAIAGLFEKGAEIGPRALGHRSLVGSPLIAANWARLNRLKGREQWRPVAPIALPEDAARHFDGIPADSYYMLFNARARTRELPAVTHVDGTARVQIAHPDNGFVYELLGRFKALSGFGVLINTSFNGRDEPVVETPEDALRAFLRMRFDFLYLDGMLLRPRAEPRA